MNAKCAQQTLYIGIPAPGCTQGLHLVTQSILVIKWLRQV